MGHREVRPVARGWHHPREDGTYADGSPRYKPLGSRDDLLWALNDYADTPADWDAAPDRADYMPEIPEGTPYQFALYETTSEGTPVSPPFPTLEELAEWCATGATVFADYRWTAEQWLASFREDTTGVDSLLILDSSGMHVGDPAKGR